MHKTILARAATALVILALCCVPARAEADRAKEILAGMTLREKVGQLFIIRPEQLNTSSKSDGTQSLNDSMRKTYADYPAGGFIFFARNIRSAKQLKEFTAALRTLGDIPPILAVDEEGGPVARLGNHKAIDVPRVKNMASIGRTGDPENARVAGETIGTYLAEYGFTLDFAPVADVNTNPKNTVIGNRAFGSDPALAAEMAGAYIQGLHAAGIQTTLKHFPGHGDTTADTHSGFVAVSKTWEELLAVEMIPFIENLDATDVVMAAHITLENVTDDGLPATLSRQVITRHLREELGYYGVVVTDSLSMGAITKNYSSAEAAVLAIEAGVDLLLMPYSYANAYKGVLEAVQCGRITQARLDESVLRILRLKLGDA